jgi:thioredoxin reductase (NADPH)
VATGGQAGTSSRIENYLGFPTGISGAELAERAVVQADRFGARISVPTEATAISRRDGLYAVRLDDGSEFEDTSVYYAATQAEVRLCAHDPVVIVGGGNSAGQAALFLSRHASAVWLLIRGRHLGAGMSRYLADRIEGSPAIEVLLHTEVRELLGDKALDAVVAEDSETGTRHRLAAKALFVFIGAEPHAGWLGDLVALDDHGFVLTGDQAPGAPGGRRGDPADIPNGQRLDQARGRSRRRGIDGCAPDPRALRALRIHNPLDRARRPIPARR